MSFYNMLFGMNAQAAVLISPFLPQEASSFPRFRDVFLSADDAPPPLNKADIFVYTRMGGGNRECVDECSDDERCTACIADDIEELDTCLGSWDDDYDCTYRTFAFSVSDEHLDDFSKVKDGRINETSEWYKARIREMYGHSEKIMTHFNSLCSAAQGA